MLRGYRLIYLKSPHALPTLWEWEQPYIHNLIVNSRSFKTTKAVQRYFRDWDDLNKENEKIWQEHYRLCRLYDHIDTWRDWLDEHRQVVLDVQEIYEENPDWRSPGSL